MLVPTSGSDSALSLLQLDPFLDVKMTVRDATRAGPLVVAASMVVFLGVQSLDHPHQSHPR